MTALQIRASSLRRQYFSEVLKALEQDNLQMIRDMDVRWSSTLLMVERALLLRAVSQTLKLSYMSPSLYSQAIEKFLASRDMRELQKYQLSVHEWNALEVFQKILAVRATSNLIYIYLMLFLQVPHAFQQRLSAEKTPTLCDALPSFEAMKKVWTQQKVDLPHAASIIEAGLDKLGNYRERAALVPAYVLAMGQSSVCY